MVSAKQKAVVVGVSLLVLFGLVGAMMAYQQVPEGHEGVEKNWGAVNGNTLDSGANWIVPVMQSVQNVETRPRTYTRTNKEGEGAQSSSDAVTVKTVNGTSVDVGITVRYTIDPNQADKFVSEWNNERQMEQRLIRPTIESNLQDEASNLQTTGEGSIYTNAGRESLRVATEEALNEEVEGEPITIERVQIRQPQLPKEIDQTLDEKESAKQKVQVEKERVKQAEAVKQRRIVEAEAEAEEVRIAAEADAEATRIRGEALEEHPVVLRQQKIDAYDDGTVFVTDGNTSMIMDTSTTTEDDQ
jgi:Membrane protease subunits, stomatin/prohibitin homologs